MHTISTALFSKLVILLVTFDFVVILFVHSDILVKVFIGIPSQHYTLSTYHIILQLANQTCIQPGQKKGESFFMPNN